MCESPHWTLAHRAQESCYGKLAVSTSRPSILMIEHGLGGGVAKHVLDLAGLLRNRAEFLRLRPNRGGLMEVSSLGGKPAPALYFQVPSEIAGLAEFLRASVVGRIHFHHTLRIGSKITELPQVLGVPYDFTVHDYYCFCPQITLTTESFRYCGEPDEEGCKRCLQIRPASTKESIQAWRARNQKFVEGADRVFVPSRSVEQKMRRHFPDAAIILASHPEPVDVTGEPQRIWRHRGGNLRIVVLGTLNAIKGADLLEACALDAADKKLPLEFHLVGDAYRSLSRAASRLTVHGRYRDSDLPTLLERLAPDLIWFPTQWPETYSYTLSAALRAGLPVAATDLGAFHDRLAGRSLSWTLPWTARNTEWNEFFLKLRCDPLLGDGHRVPFVGDGSAQFSYASDYLLKQPVRIVASAVARDFHSFRRPLRASPSVLARYIKGYARDFLSAAYRQPGIRRLAITVFPEHRLQMLRRWLDKF